jgi:hypothetical protein
MTETVEHLLCRYEALSSTPQSHRAPVAHGCNPSYIRRQRSEGSQFEASPGKQFHKTLSQKTLHKNRSGGVAQGEGPEFKPQYCKTTITTKTQSHQKRKKKRKN